MVRGRRKDLILLRIKLLDRDNVIPLPGMIDGYCCECCQPEAAIDLYTNYVAMLSTLAMAAVEMMFNSDGDLSIIRFLRYCRRPWHTVFLLMSYQTTTL